MIRWRNRFATTFLILVIVTVGVVLAALGAGYRPVVIQTGSMGTTAPPGSLIVAMPRDGLAVSIGDILVMRRPGATPVTHRVIEIDQAGAASPFAITQGDANEARDAAPYPLEGEQLVARWIAPEWGGRLERVFQPGASLALVAAAVVAVTISTLRRIWAAPQRSPAAVSRPAATSNPASPPKPAASAIASGARSTSARGHRRRRLLAVLAIPLVGMMTAGVAFALFVSGETVASNDFTTSACFDSQLSSIQSGENIHAVDGVVTVPITAVTTAATFVMASVRSSASETADATVEVVLRADGAALELTRNTDAGVPPAVTVAWSVVEYGCGVSVQRGTVLGDGTSQLDIPITAVDQGSSFVLASTTAEPSATDFGADDLFIAELTSGTNLRIRAAGATPFNTQRRFSWQVVSFADQADATIQVATGTVGSGATSAALTLASPVDPEATFLIAAVNSTASGPDIGKRLIRARLTDSTTVTIDRSVGGEVLDVNVQVVTLYEGTTVRHGTVDFSTGESSKSIAVPPVDPTRSTAASTVAIPGMTGGGMTDHAVDDVVGEASATFSLAGSETLNVGRDGTSSNASFAWQVIEWAGPRWWDTDWSFRQRIDVETTTAPAPGGYSVPLTFDHAAMVTSGLSRGDGDDVRVVRWDGAAWSELDRVLGDGSGWSAVTTTIWFKTVDPIASDSTGTYWLYTGSGTPGAAPADPEAVYLLNEDFESGTLGDFEDRTGGTGWYQADSWSRRIRLTAAAAHVPSDLTNVPLRVAVTNADLATMAQADASDVRFTATDGLSVLDHEIEYWDPATGTLVAWVRAPSLSSSADTALYLYYGAPDAPAGEQIHDVWSAGFAGAWHLARDPSGSAPQIDDSTIANRDGLNGGSMTTGDLEPTVLGRGLTFDGVDDRAELGLVAIGAADALTVEAWVKPGTFGAPATIMSRQNGANVLFDLLLDPVDASNANAEVQLQIDGVVVSAFGATTIATGDWSHLAATFDGSTLTLFVNGAPGTPVAAPGRVTHDPAANVAIGAKPGGAAPFLGTIDEVRVSDVARSEDWLDTHIANVVTAGFMTATAPVSGTWFGQGVWTLRKPITIHPDVTDGDELDLPVLVQIVDAQLQAGAQADGDDIVFTAADGVTRLDHVIESYDQLTGALTSWVKVPTLDSNDTTEIFLYYANSTAGDQQDPVGVFDAANDLTLLGDS